MRAIKLQHDTIYPEGEWRNIATEDEEGIVDDSEVYHYLPRDELDKIKVGDIIELDEYFKVLEVD